MSLLDALLAQELWETHAGLLAAAREGPLWRPFCDGLAALNRAALYQSEIHGEGHIERVMLLGTLLAHAEGLPPAEFALLLDACAYHDVGRVDDSLDDYHGLRSAARLAALTGRTGEELRLIMAAVEAHSRDDRDMDDILRAHGPSDHARARRLAELLKDSDGLDRVRIHAALDPRYLRRPQSERLIPFAQFLFSRYRAEPIRF